MASSLADAWLMDMTATEGLGHGPWADGRVMDMDNEQRAAGWTEEGHPGRGRGRVLVDDRQTHRQTDREQLRANPGVCRDPPASASPAAGLHRGGSGVLTWPAGCGHPAQQLVQGSGRPCPRGRGQHVELGGGKRVPEDVACGDSGRQMAGGPEGTAHGTPGPRAARCPHSHVHTQAHRLGPQGKSRAALPGSKLTRAVLGPWGCKSCAHAVTSGRSHTVTWSAGYSRASACARAPVPPAGCRGEGRLRRSHSGPTGGLVGGGWGG